MTDGQVQDGHRVLSARKRMGMVGVLAVVAGTAVFFNAEEQAAEAKIWDSEMAGSSALRHFPLLLTSFVLCHSCHACRPSH